MNKIYIVILSSVVLFSCGDKSMSEKLGDKVGQSVTDFTKGVGKGIDEQMVANVSISEEMKDLGFTKTVAKSFGLASPKNGFSVYLISTKAYKPTFISKAYDSNNMEIGRSKVSSKFGSDEAKYIDFIFDKKMDSQLVKKYTINVVP